MLGIRGDLDVPTFHSMVFHEIFLASWYERITSFSAHTSQRMTTKFDAESPYCVTITPTEHEHAVDVKIQTKILHFFPSFLRIASSRFIIIVDVWWRSRKKTQSVEYSCVRFVKIIRFAWRITCIARQKGFTKISNANPFHSCACVSGENWFIRGKRPRAYYDTTLYFGIGFRPLSVVDNNNICPSDDDASVWTFDHFPLRLRFNSRLWWMRDIWHCPIVTQTNVFVAFRFVSHNFQMEMDISTTISTKWIYRIVCWSWTS